jgi:hypothetical protein
MKTTYAYFVRYRATLVAKRPVLGAGETIEHSAILRRPTFVSGDADLADIRKTIEHLILDDVISVEILSLNFLHALV